MICPVWVSIWNKIWKPNLKEWGAIPGRHTANIRHHHHDLTHEFGRMRVNVTLESGMQLRNPSETYQGSRVIMRIRGLGSDLEVNEPDRLVPTARDLINLITLAIPTLLRSPLVAQLKPRLRRCSLRLLLLLIELLVVYGYFSETNGRCKEKK